MISNLVKIKAVFRKVGASEDCLGCMNIFAYRRLIIGTEFGVSVAANSDRGGSRLIQLGLCCCLSNGVIHGSQIETLLRLVFRTRCSIVEDN